MSQCNLMKNGIHINPQGYIDYCCEMPSNGVYRPQFTDYNTFKEHALGAYEISKTRWHEGCSGCKYNEDHGKDSLRNISYNQTKHVQEEDTSIVHSIINTGSICNLACRMCGPGNSSRWAQYLKHGTTAEESRDFISYNVSTSIYDQHTMDVLYKDVLTPKLRYISFAGGEPTQNYRCEEIIRFLIEKDYAKNMMLHVVTNATRPFTEWWGEAIQQFRTLDITVSMDGTHSNYDYIRQGAEFDNVITNLLDLKKKVRSREDQNESTITVAYCWQALNAHKYTYDKKYFEGIDIEMNPQVVHDPNYMGLNSIPKELMRKYGIADMYSKPFNEKGLFKLSGSMRWMDTLFDKVGEFEKQCPDLFDYKGVAEIYYEGKQWA